MSNDYMYLGHPAEDPVAGMPAGPELDTLLVEALGLTRIAPFYSNNDIWGPSIMSRMSELGWCARIGSPFTAGDKWWAGFTPMGMSGWNGSPDYDCPGETFALAVCRAAVLAMQNRSRDEAEATWNDDANP